MFDAGGRSAADGGSSRDDLGYVGNKIRDQVNGELEKDLFEHYWLGSGKDYYLSNSDFQYILNNSVPEGSRTKISDSLSVQLVNCYSNKNLDQSIGRGKVYYDNKTGQAVGFSDVYDFDPQPLGRRSLSAEAQTRAVNYASKMFGNSHLFRIRYGRIR
ncbi:MAG TPA: hypothetical protein DC049_02265 [Spirochaetia bacterium]|nr:hypothetical protein [Spirochaetia bacterium]